VRKAADWVLCGRKLRTPPGPKGSNGKQTFLGATGVPGQQLYAHNPSNTSLSEQLLSPAHAAQSGLVLRVHPGQVTLLLSSLVVTALIWSYAATERSISLDVGGRFRTLHTHQQTIGALLTEDHFKLDSADIVLPPLDTPLDQAGTPRLWLAQPVEIAVDGQVLRISSQTGSLADTLDALSVHLTPADRLWFNDGYIGANTLFSELQLPAIDPHGERRPVRLSVERALPVYLSDDGIAATVHTFALTVADVLRENDFQVHANDRISPGLRQAVSAGMHVLIERSKPVTVLIDGKLIDARTREQTVGRMLAGEGIRLQPRDYTRPPIEAPVQDNMRVQVVRVREEMVQEAISIPYAKLLQADDNLEIDKQSLKQRGLNGEHRKLFKVVYEDGKETRRTLEQEWDARQPVAQITLYGRKIVMHDLATPLGTVQYWRLTRMYATSYSPIRSGTSPAKPWYGHTSSGLPAGKGVVAVDQSVVPWLSRLYVTGYGIGTAGDTGNGVKGKLIDLGFDDSNYESWHRWVDMYWLWPPPDPKSIRWILPNNPVERLQ
jgi:uncharacterized protein YabE (DUF348 family)